MAPPSPRLSRQEPIAIVGLGALFPGSSNVHGFWRDVVTGKDQLREIPSAHWLLRDYYDADPKAPDKTYAKRGAFIDPVPFDPLEFGMPPTVIPATDTSQLLGLIVAKQLLDDATRGGTIFPDATREKTSVILGITSAQELLVEMGSRLQRPIWAQALREQGMPEDEIQTICDRIAGSYTPWQENTFPGLLGNVVAGRIANRLNLGGTNCVVDAACASTFGALAMGVQELYLGSSDLVITGGVEAFNDIFMFMCFSKTTALSFSGECRPFDAKSDGTMLGEGIGLVALRRLADAERDGNPIYAVLQGVGSSSDGRSKSIYAPVSSGQAKALHRAYESAGYGPETVELVEAHGTGTKAGDVAEFEGLRSVFDASGRADRQWCALGSIKSQIGHTKAAAGAAGLMKATLALHHKVLPPTIKIEQPNPGLNLPSTPFYLNTAARPWIRDASHPRRAAVSSFGFGGSNFHLTLEEYTGAARAALLRSHSPAELVALSAASIPALRERIDQVLKDAAADESLGGIAQKCGQTFRIADQARLLVVASSIADLTKKLETAGPKLDNGPFTSPDGTAFGVGSKLQGQVAFLFPGQGSQTVGMGGDLAMAFDAARSAWDESAAFRFGSGGSGERGVAIHEVVFPIPVYDDESRKAQSARLVATEWAQPGLGVASLATLRLLRSLGLDASVFGGHSFGEVTALHAAGAYDTETFLRIARKRGELMRDASASTGGAMWAIVLGKKSVSDLEVALANHSTPAAREVVIANRNSPSQIVIAGPSAAVNEVAAALQTQGFRATRLPVATAFHSPVVAKSVGPFNAFLHDARVFSPEKTVFANATAAPYETSADSVRRTLGSQIASPVRFAEQVEAMYASGVRTFVEVGPGAVLTGLVKDTLGDSNVYTAVATDRKNTNGVVAFLQAVAQLAATGHAMELTALFSGTRSEPAKAAVKPHAVMISGTNYAKPYPPQGGTAETRAKQVSAKRRVETPPRAKEDVPAPAPLLAAAPTTSTAPQEAAAPSTTEHVRFNEPTASAAAVPRTPVAYASSNSEALTAFSEIQRQTADAHAAFQRSMAEAHLAFLRTAEAAMSAIGGGGDFVGLDFGTVPAPSAATWPLAPVAPRVQELLAQPQSQPATPPPTIPSAKTESAPAPVSQPATTPPSALSSVLLDVTAEKTGYPKDMLGLDMEIESDLGIDSIKRVEILSAVQERVPGLPSIPASELGSLRTLGQILARFGQSPAPEALPQPRPQSSGVAAVVAPVTQPAPVAVKPTAAISSVLLEVTAEKTGYPKDMLGLDMEIESDLGIDSIKRVEILSAVQERIPGLPSIPAAELGSLRTLGQILARFGETRDSEPHAMLSPAPAPAAQVTAAQVTTSPAATAPPPTLSLSSVLLEVTAEKTGYPKDMLGLDMEIESELGIDSIKRVEILSAVQERVPGLPSIPAAELGSLRTLGQILARFELKATSVAASAGTVTIEKVTSSSPADQQAPLPTFVEERVAVARPGFSPRGIFSGPVLVVRDAGGVAEALCVLLQDAGVAALPVDELDTPAARVIDLSCLSDVNSPDEAIRLQKEVFEKARDVTRSTSQERIFVAVFDAFDSKNVESHREWLGGVPGLLRTMAIECPDVVCRAIELSRGSKAPHNIAEEIAEEILQGGATLDVRLAGNGERTTTRFTAETQARVVRSAPSTGEKPVLVVSGGARGVTAACLIALARESKWRFAILGRTNSEHTPEWANTFKGSATTATAAFQRAFIAHETAEGRSPTPSKARDAAYQAAAALETRTTIAELEAHGSEVLYLPCDVRHETDIATAVAAIRTAFGRIDGIVHAAGALHDKRIHDKTDAQFETVFDTKVAGLRHLLKDTKNENLRWIVLFGSVAGRIGNPGQCDYAMANETLERVALAEASRRKEARITTLHWGPWDGGMVTPPLKQMFQERGVSLIDMSAGTRVFVDAMLAGAPEQRVRSVVVGARPDAALFLGKADGHRAVDLECVISKSSWPQLESHAVRGVPVVPVALAVELMARAARHARPDLHLVALRDVRVVKGIRVPHFDGVGLRLRVSAREVANGAVSSLDIEITSLDGPRRVTHYRAHAEMDKHPRHAERVQVPSNPTTPWNLDEVYGPVLFHGPAFQSVRSIETMTSQGGSAFVATTQEMRWSGGPFVTDPMLVDSALQLAILLGVRATSRTSLPTRVGEIRFFETRTPPADMRCHLAATQVADLKTISDARITTPEGETLIDIKGIEMHILALIPLGTTGNAESQETA